ncbi:MAG: hypothetical protein K2K02_01130 [Ruminococcus sp.]|nr:hypothetical protein [Ruminococcus sp.]MDE6677619.1 hypothetical protein [Ruminococcus sp.]
MAGKTSASEIFEIPKFYYFESGNDYSGSMGDFTYKIVNSNCLKCLTWHGKLCSMKATIENEKEFEKTQKGFEELIEWLESKYRE